MSDISTPVVTSKFSVGSIRSTSWCIVIHLPYTTLGRCQMIHLDSSKLSALFKRWFYIFHDKDRYTLDDKCTPDLVGSLKPFHYHLVVQSTRCRKGGLIRVLSKVLGLPTNLISVIPSDNFLFDLRYLIHIDDSDKYQYPFSAIVTNDSDYLNSHFVASSTVTTDRVIMALRNCHGDICFIYQTLGKEVADSYQHLIYTYFSTHSWLGNNRKYAHN